MTQGNNWLDENFTGYNVVYGAGVPVPQRKVLNFGSGLTVGDDPTTGVTTITGTGSAPLLVTALVTTPPLNPSVQEFYIASGYSTPGDGGGGTFVWNSTDTRAADGGTIIAVTGIATGRWNRVYSGQLDVRWFGAGDVSIVADSTAAFRAALNAPTLSIFTLRRVYAPTGTYGISGNLAIPDHTELFGDPPRYSGPGGGGQLGTVLRWIGGNVTADMVSIVTSTSDLREGALKNLVITGNFNGAANTLTGLRISGSWPGYPATGGANGPFAVSSWRFDHLIVAECNEGLHLGDGIGAGQDNQADSLKFSFCQFQYCNTYGVHSNSNNALDASEFYCCFAQGNLTTLPSAIGWFIEYAGFHKYIHCESTSVDTFVKTNAASGNAIIFENCECENTNRAIWSYGASDGRVLTSINCSFNAAIQIDGIDRMVDIGSPLTCINAAGAYVGMTLGAGARFDGYGSRPQTGFFVTENGGTFNLHTLPTAGGLYDQEIHSQGQTIYRAGKLYGEDGLNAIGLADFCERSGRKGAPWVASTAIATNQWYIATPDNGTAFLCVANTGDTTTGSVQPTWNTHATTIAAGSDNQPASAGTIYVASTTGFAASGTITILQHGTLTIVTYTSITGGGTPSFNGCTGGTGSTYLGNVVGANTTDHNVTWGACSVSAMTEIVGVPGHLRFDGIPGIVARQGTKSYLRASVGVGTFDSYTAIRDTHGAVTADWRPSGVLWGDGVGSCGFPLSGSAVDGTGLGYKQVNVNVGSGTTYSLSAAEAATPFLTLTGTPSGTCTVTVPASASGTVNFYRIFNNTAHDAVISAGGATVTVTAGATGKVIVGGTAVITY